MAALIDSSAEGFSAANVSSLSTGSFTVAGSNRVLYASIASGAGSPVAPSGAKWEGSGGTAMTLLDSTRTVNTFGRHSLYRLIAPNASTSTGYASWGSNQDETLIIFTSVKDADQTTPNGTIAQAFSSTLTASVSATSVSGDLVLDAMFLLFDSSTSKTLTVGASQTSLQTIEGTDVGGYECSGMSYETAAGTSTTMSWTVGGVGSGATNGINSFAFAVNAVSGGGGPTLTAAFKSCLGVGR